MLGTIETVSNTDDLKTYRIEVEFTPEEPTEDGSLKFFIIETNSLLRPSVRIPFKYELKSGVYSEPDVISLGSVAKGTTIEKTVKLISAENESFYCSVTNKPENCSVKIHEEKGEAILNVKITPETTGVLQGEIELQVHTESEIGDLTVKYIGYVR